MAARHSPEGVIFDMTHEVQELLREAFEQVAAQAAELRAKLVRTIIRAMQHVLEIMALSSSLFFACVRVGSFKCLLSL
jgi:hypothetical protein